MNLPPFILNQDDERANPARLLAVVEDSPGRTLVAAGFTDFVTTCSIPIIERTRRPKPAIRGDGSFASVHMADTHCEYKALSNCRGFVWLTAPFVMQSFSNPGSECCDESSESGEPCKIPEVASGLLEEILPSLDAEWLSPPTLDKGPS